MSFRGEKYDGDLFGSGVNIAERRNPFDYESKTDGNASAKRTARKVSALDSEENAFDEGNDKDRYLLTYSDLITLLLGLFIILYAISNIDANKYRNVVTAMGNFFGNETGVQINPETKVISSPKESLSDQLRKLIVDYHYSRSIQLEESERGITVHILEDILFPPGRADLTESSKLVLNRLAVVIKKLPNDIRVEGHTDNAPINTMRYPSNWHLSVDRALNTAYYLIKDEEVDPDRVSIVGNAEYRPIDLNNSSESKTKNRRVDLVILK
jgi:chemotaxis protein MotB